MQAPGQKWPFTMSDTTNAGADLRLPSLMICAADGAALLSALDGPRDGAEQIWGVARSHDHHTSCAVFLQEMTAEEARRPAASPRPDPDPEPGLPARVCGRGARCAAAVLPRLP